MQILRIGVGAVITFIGLTIGLGSVEAATGILVMSIVCTVGISLIIWLPIWLFIGWIALGIYDAIAQKTGWPMISGTLVNPSVNTPVNSPVNTPQDRVVSLSPNRQALVNYAKKARSSGLSDTQIATRLAAQGWNNEEIEFAQRMANETP